MASQEEEEVVLASLLTFYEMFSAHSEEAWSLSYPGTTSCAVLPHVPTELWACEEYVSSHHISVNRNRLVVTTSKGNEKMSLALRQE